MVDQQETRKQETDGGEAGWTFIETLVVIGIILILSASVGFTAFRYLDKAKVVAAKSQIETFALALDSYYLDCGRYPTAEQGLGALWERPSLAPVPSGWGGPYLSRKVPADPWGNAYEYSVPGKGGLPYGLRAFGADGREGGDGNDEDITSWDE